MACLRPMGAVYGAGGKVVMTSRAGFHDRHLELPCGHCRGCRRDQAADWALRCQHEAKNHLHADGSSNNCFITLTFSDEGLDRRKREQGTHPAALAVRDWQLFAKRLRKAVGPFKFMMSAEYGEGEGRRPHYHALLFGQDFTGDRDQWGTRSGNPFFRSPTLEKAWGYGFHEIGLMVPETINYVCRYVMKKQRGQRKKELPTRLDSKTGEIISVPHEFALMSRGGTKGKGIGYAWFQENQRDAFPSDYLITQGRRTRVPAYYLRLLEEKDPNTARKVRVKRSKKAKEAKRKEEDRHKRLQAKEVILEAHENLYQRQGPNHID